MNICVKNEGEMKKVPKNQIISGDPLSQLLCFWSEELHMLLDVAIN